MQVCITTYTIQKTETGQVCVFINLVKPDIHNAVPNPKCKCLGNPISNSFFSFFFGKKIFLNDFVTVHQMVNCSGKMSTKIEKLGRPLMEKRRTKSEYFALVPPKVL